MLVTLFYLRVFILCAMYNFTKTTLKTEFCCLLSVIDRIVYYMCCILSVDFFFTYSDFIFSQNSISFQFNIETERNVHLHC